MYKIVKFGFKAPLPAIAFKIYIIKDFNINTWLDLFYKTWL